MDDVETNPQNGEVRDAAPLPTEGRTPSGSSGSEDERRLPFVDDHQAHYDIDGTTYADDEVIVSSDALRSDVNREADELRREVHENRSPKMKVPLQ